MERVQFVGGAEVWVSFGISNVLRQFAEKLGCSFTVLERSRRIDEMREYLKMEVWGEASSVHSFKQEFLKYLIMHSMPIQFTRKVRVLQKQVELGDSIIYRMKGSSAIAEFFSAMKRALAATTIEADIRIQEEAKGFFAFDKKVDITLSGEPAFLAAAIELADSAFER